MGLHHVHVKQVGYVSMTDLVVTKVRDRSSNLSNDNSSNSNTNELPYSTLEEFLKHIERRAFHMARLSTRHLDDAHDIVQESMYKLIEKYAQKQPKDWRPLFFTILNSKITDYYRRNLIRDKIFLKIKPAIQDFDDYANWENNTAKAPSDYEPNSRLSRQQNINKLSFYIKQLPNRQKQAFMLRCWEGYSTQETASIMACSQGSVKTHYSRAIKKLRTLLEAQHD
jgi:RNA polymerase sigma-70 factor (ECF subfamily)